MALKPCRECGQQVSEEAAACPHCGVTAPTRERTKEWVPCPKCGSAKTVRAGAGAVAAASLLGAGCAVWIPIVGWALIPFFLLFAVIAGISAFFPSGKAAFQCRSCKAWFTVPKAALLAGLR